MLRSRRVLLFFGLTLLVAVVCGGSSYWLFRTATMNLGGLTVLVTPVTKTRAAFAMAAWAGGWSVCSPSPDFDWYWYDSSSSELPLGDCTPGFKDGKNCVGWVDYGPCHYSEYAETLTWYDLNNATFIVETDVGLNTQCYLNGYFQQEDAAFFIFGHEFGHVLGLSHSAGLGQNQSIMETYHDPSAPFAIAPQADDCQRARNLYPP